MRDDSRLKGFVMAFTARILLLLALAFTLTGSYHGDAAGLDLAYAEDSLANGDLQGALDYIAKALAADPDSYKAYSMRAFLYLKNGRRAEAIADFTSLIRLKPKDASSYISRGMTYDELGNVSAARDDYRKACELGDKSGCTFLEESEKKGR